MHPTTVMYIPPASAPSDGLDGFISVNSDGGRVGRLVWLNTGFDADVNPFGPSWGVFGFVKDRSAVVKFLGNVLLRAALQGGRND